MSTQYGLNDLSATTKATVAAELHYTRTRYTGACCWCNATAKTVYLQALQPESAVSRKPDLFRFAAVLPQEAEHSYTHVHSHMHYVLFAFSLSQSTCLPHEIPQKSFN